MTGVLLPLALTAVAAMLTYRCCVRPMLRGTRMTGDPAGSVTPRAAGCCAPPDDMDRQLAAARAEADRLRERSTASLSATDRPG